MSLTIDGTNGIETNTDTGKIKVGTDDDLQIYHDGTDNTSKIALSGKALQIIGGGSNNKVIFAADTNNAALLYHNNSKKFETYSNGTLSTGNMKCTGSAYIGNQVDGHNGNSTGQLFFGAGNDLKMYHDGSDSFIDHTTGSGSLVIKCDSTGSAGIHLDSDYIKFRNEAQNETLLKAVNGGAVELYYDDSKKFNTTSSGINVESTGNTPVINFTGASNNEVARIDGDAISGTAGNLRFYTETSGSITEKAKITSDGWFKAKGNRSGYLTGQSYHEILSDNSDNVILALTHDSSNGYGMNIQLNHSNTTKYAYQLYSTSDSVVRFVVRGDGDCENSNNSYGSTSDVKLKENIVDAKSQWNDIKGLRVRNFNFKADTSKTKMLGLVAQEAELIAPGLVKEIDDIDIDNKELGTKTKVLKYSILYMKAIKALQEAMARIETLETKVAALETA